MKIENEPAAYGLLAGLLTLLACLLLLACGSCATPMKVSGAPRTDIEQTSNTYRVHTWCIDDIAFPSVGLGRLAGSAVMVDARHLLTAFHVVNCENGTAAINIVAPDGRRFTGFVQRTWPGHDIAQIYVSSALPGEGVRIGPAPQVGDTLCTRFAYPAFGTACGVVLRVNTEPNHLDSDITHSAPSISGNSGGGVYDREGRLVGIVTQWMREPITGTSIGGNISTLARLKLTP